MEAALTQIYPKETKSRFWYSKIFTFLACPTYFSPSSPCCCWRIIFLCILETACDVIDHASRYLSMHLAKQASSALSNFMPGFLMHLLKQLPSMA